MVAKFATMPNASARMARAKAWRQAGSSPSSRSARRRAQARATSCGGRRRPPPPQGRQKTFDGPPRGTRCHRSGHIRCPERGHHPPNCSFSGHSFRQKRRSTVPRADTQLSYQGESGNEVQCSQEHESTRPAAAFRRDVPCSPSSRDASPLAVLAGVTGQFQDRKSCPAPTGRHGLCRPTLPLDAIHVTALPAHGLLRYTIRSASRRVRLRMAGLWPESCSEARARAGNPPAERDPGF
jgi:hypothetical protein